MSNNEIVEYLQSKGWMRACEKNYWWHTKLGASTGVAQDEAFQLETIGHTTEYCRAVSDGNILSPVELTN